MDFSLVSLTQNDKNSVDFFAVATPCKPLGRFVLTHFAQNDKNKPKARFVVILSAAKYPKFKFNSKFSVNF